MAAKPNNTPEKEAAQLTACLRAGLERHGHSRQRTQVLFLQAAQVILSSAPLKKLFEENSSHVTSFLKLWHEHHPQLSDAQPSPQTIRKDN